MMLSRILLFSVLAIYSCKQAGEEQYGNVAERVNEQKSATEIDYDDSIAGFFIKALNVDSIEFNNQFEEKQSFLFFKSGYIISKAAKNVLVVVCPTDTTYKVSLYSIYRNKWSALDSISGLDAFSATRFNLILNDYNFDGQKDIYLQVNATDGWSLSKGHLIIIDPGTKKFELHKEARNFANMVPDLKSRTIFSESWNGYDAKNRHRLTIFTNKWIKGQLKTISEKDTLIESK